jgi:hypothetical protein
MLININKNNACNLNPSIWRNYYMVEYTVITLLSKIPPDLRQFVML